MKKIVLMVSVFLLLVLFNSAAFCQIRNLLLEEGIKQYKSENYEEAIKILEKVRAEEPKYSLAAFFLGMAYKQTTDNNKAALHLEDALTLKPAVKEALVEYINILFQIEKLTEAKKWIKIAQEQNIAPANIAFLEGLILAREKNYAVAVESFEKAKSLDQQLTQAGDYQIAICYVNSRKFKDAQKRFKATASHDPNSDLAVYARQYLEAVENSLFYTRPSRVTLGLSGGYNTNILSKPRNPELASAISSDNKRGNSLQPSVRIEFTPGMEGPWLFNASCSATPTINSQHTHTHDAITNSISMLPGYNFGRFSISMLGNYTHFLLRTDDSLNPDGNAGYKHYEDYFTGGPIVKIMLTETQILELFGGYDKKNYYNQVVTSNENLRDAQGLRAYISWIWFYRNNGFVNLRYDISNEAADGTYCNNKSNSLSASVVLPVLPDNVAQKIGFMYLQLASGFTWQDHSHPQPYSDVDGTWILPGNKRQDKVYNGSASLNWDITKNWSGILQYTHIKSDSNIPVYEYDRDLYTAGIEFKF
jgi:tetratricopeptide (TPR) repeat protein